MELAGPVFKPRMCHSRPRMGQSRPRMFHSRPSMAHSRSRMGYSRPSMAHSRSRMGHARFMKAQVVVGFTTIQEDYHMVVGFSTTSVGFNTIWLDLALVSLLG